MKLLSIYCNISLLGTCFCSASIYDFSKGRIDIIPHPINGSMNPPFTCAYEDCSLNDAISDWIKKFKGLMTNENPDLGLPKLVPFSNPGVFHEDSDWWYSYKLKDLWVFLLNEFNITTLRIDLEDQKSKLEIDLGITWPRISTAFLFKWAMFGDQEQYSPARVHGKNLEANLKLSIGKNDVGKLHVEEFIVDYKSEDFEVYGMHGLNEIIYDNLKNNVFNVLIPNNINYCIMKATNLLNTALNSCDIGENSLICGPTTTGSFLP